MDESPQQAVAENVPDPGTINPSDIVQNQSEDSPISSSSPVVVPQINVISTTPNALLTAEQDGSVNKLTNAINQVKITEQVRRKSIYLRSNYLNNPLFSFTQ